MLIGVLVWVNAPVDGSNRSASFAFEPALQLLRSE